MARTRCMPLSSSKLKLNFPCASVLVWPASSIPAASLIKTTSSPADGLPVVPLVMVPLSFAAQEFAVRNRIPSDTIAVCRIANFAFKLFAPSCSELQQPVLRHPIAKSPPEFPLPPLRVSLSNSDNPHPEPYQPCIRNLDRADFRRPLLCALPEKTCASSPVPRKPNLAR